MEATTARVVRVPRKDDAIPPTEGEGSEGPASAPESRNGEELRNTGGRERSVRLYLMGFVLTPAIVALLFAAWIASSRYASAPTTLPSLVGLGLIVVAGAGVGLPFTLLRTPRAFRLPDPTTLEVEGFFGGWRTISLGEQPHYVPLETYPAGWLGRRPSELVEVVRGPLGRVRWVVEYRLLDAWVPRQTPGGPTPREGSGGP